LKPVIQIDFSPFCSSVLFNFTLTAFENHHAAPNPNLKGQDLALGYISPIPHDSKTVFTFSASPLVMD